MSLVQRFKEDIQKLTLFNGKEKLLLAVSGGIDSVVLCELCKRAEFHFSIAHCNFGLRGEESDRDEKFVRTLAEKYGVEIFIKKFATETYATENKLSIQEAARDLRYQWFEQLRRENHFAFVLLAHHADDNIETLLMNFFRGTGLQGLTGIPEGSRENKLLRPLLSFRRAEIEEFARTAGLLWVEDSSNASIKYTRNFFRHQILPAIKKVYPGVEENLLNTIERFKEINTLYQQSVQNIKRAISEQGGGELRIPVLRLLKLQNKAVIYEVIRDFGFGEKQVEEVIKLLQADSGKFIENEKFQIIRHRKWLVIAPKTSIAGIVAIHEGQEEIKFSGGVLHLKRLSEESFVINKQDFVAMLDAKHIAYPLLLRKWKAGDYFYPLGMPKKKKLSRFFIDRKLSKSQKENTWVLESGKKIIWVVGQRIDDRFKITPSTKTVLQINLTSL